MTIPIACNNAPESDVMDDVELKEPKRRRVVLHNDDYTTMDFVVEILCTVFHKSQQEAVAIMLAVHETGRGDCGVYPAEVAETKVFVVQSKARAAGFPLRCSLEDV